MNMTRALGLMCLLALAPARNSAQGKSDVAAIRAARARSNAAIAAHDVDAALAELDSAFQITGGNGGFIASRTAMGEGFATQFKNSPDVKYVRTPESIEVANTGLRGFESGTWVGTWTTPAGPLRTGGRYSAYWVKIADSWRIHSELFVTLYCEGAGCP